MDSNLNKTETCWGVLSTHPASTGCHWETNMPPVEKQDHSHFLLASPWVAFVLYFVHSFWIEGNIEPLSHFFEAGIFGAAKVFFSMCLWIESLFGRQGDLVSNYRELWLLVRWFFSSGFVLEFEMPVFRLALVYHFASVVTGPKRGWQLVSLCWVSGGARCFQHRPFAPVVDITILSHLQRSDCYLCYVHNLLAGDCKSARVFFQRQIDAPT